MNTIRVGDHIKVWFNGEESIRIVRALDSQNIWFIDDRQGYSILSFNIHIELIIEEAR